MTHPLRFRTVTKLFAAGLLGLLALSGLAAAGDDVPAPRAPEAHGIMVAFRTDAVLPARLRSVSRAGLEPDAAFVSPHMARLKVSAAGRQQGLSLKDSLAALRRDPTVRIAEPDYVLRASVLPNDPRFNEQWGLRNTGQVGGTSGDDIGAATAWDTSIGGNVVVAVIDTGVDYTHPDLKDNILKDGNGNVVGYDYANNDGDPMDDNEHGTHCAGIIGARGNNGVGITGVCQRVKIMPLKFMNGRGEGDTSDAIKCIDYAIAHGAKVMSNSWGGEGRSRLLLEAIQRAQAAGILFLAAAGNETQNNDSYDSYPANYNSEATNVLSVAATDWNDRLSYFSNWGARSVDLAAPGDSILSTVPRGGYDYLSGTSMATPFVAGAAALILSKYPNLSLSELKNRLLDNVTKRNGLSDRLITGGRLNVAKAIAGDTANPGTPSGLTVSEKAASGLLLTWTASGGNGSTGAAARYEVRYSTAAITDANFAQAQLVDGAPDPAAAGTNQRCLIGGLAANTQYYVALKAFSAGGNASGLATAGPARTLTSSQAVTALSDTGEGASQFTGSGSWAPTTETSASPTHSYADSPGVNYANNRRTYLTQNAGVTLTGFVPVLSFKARVDLEDEFDFLYLDVSTDFGNSWQQVGAPLTGTRAWAAYTVPLAAYYGSNLRVRFRLVTDPEYAQDGVWIDDIQIAGDRLGQSQTATPPAAPTNLAAKANGANKATLSWNDESTDETGFKLERREGTGTFAPVATVAADVRSYSDAGLKADTAYTYRVRATNPAGDSDYSNETGIQTPPAAPAAPTGLQATAGTSEILLTWQASAGAATYKVKRSLSAAGPFGAIYSGLPGTTYHDESAVAGTTYYYVVSAVNAGGESANSSAVSARLEAAAPPAKPTTLKVTVESGRVVLRWKQSVTPEVRYNRVYRGTRSGGPYTLIRDLTATTLYRDSGLRKFTTYYYVVTAVGADGQESARSNQVRIRTGNNIR